MDFGINGKVGIVTGASGGIGGAIARDLAHEGVDLALCYHTHECTELLKEIKGLGREAILVRADVSQARDAETLAELTYRHFGRIDILINNAGTGRLTSPVEETKEEDWDRLMATNLKSVFLVSKAVIPYMKRQKWGRIINIGSVVAKVSTTSRPWLDPRNLQKGSSGAYAASKAGVNALTVTLAKELAASGITVNCVAPGPTRTALVPALPEYMQDQVPVGRIGLPEEISAFVALLASQRAGFITGEIIDVNGGLWMD